MRRSSRHGRSATPGSASLPSHGKANVRRSGVCAVSSCTRSLRRSVAWPRRSRTSVHSSGRSNRARSSRSMTARSGSHAALEEDGITIAGATGRQAELALDKALQVDAAREAGLLVPQTTVVEDPEAVRVDGVPGCREARQGALRGGRAPGSTDQARSSQTPRSSSRSPRTSGVHPCSSSRSSRERAKACSGS